MKRILISTTALSVALTQIMTVPAIGQTLTEDGSVIGEDGSVLCLGTADAPCDLNAVLQELEAQRAAEAAAAAEAEAAAAAAAEAEAAAQAEAEAAAQAEAEAAAQAEAEAAAQAEAEAAAQAEAEVAAQAEAEAAAQAEAEAAAQAEAEAAAQAEAEAAAQAEAEAAAQAEAEAAAQAEVEAAAQAEAEAAAQAEAEAAAEDPAVTDETVVEEPAVEESPAEEPVAEEPAAEQPATDEAVTEEPAADAVTEEPAIEEPAAEPAPEAATEEPLTDGAAQDTATEETPPEETAPVEGEVVTDGAVEADPAAEPAPADETLGGTVEPFVVEEPADLVDPAAAEAPSEEALETLSTLLAAPDQVTEESVDQAPALVPEAAAAVEADPTVQSDTAQDVIVNEITQEMTRTSAQDFAAPATASLAAAAAAAPEDDGLTDLQKFGLVALGALAVGAIINANRDQVVSNTGDRVVVRRGADDYYIYKDDDALLRQPGATVRTETFRDGSTRTIVDRADGTQVVTIRDATGRVLRRATYDGLGREIVLIDDLYPEERIDISTLPKPRGRVISLSTSEEDALLRARMAALDSQELGRSFSLRQIREVREVRALAATVDVNNITFDSGSAAIKAQQAESLAALGRLMRSMIDENPNEVFLIEGHTDAVGSASLNLTLSDRRAESVALALTEYFDVPPENMVVQGYGESELRVNTQEAERQNRRVAVRIITPLLRSAELR